MRRNTTVGYTPASSLGRRTVATTIGAVVVGLGLIIVAFFLGRATVNPTSDVGSTGGLSMQSGIPIPDRHSIAGAATAAANYQIAGFRVLAGTLNPAAATAVLLAPSASYPARQVLARPTASANQLTETRTTYAPLSLVVQSYNGAHAVVQIWGVAASSTQVTPRPAGTEDWGRATVTLAWTNGQWRVTDQHFAPGPWPARDDERMASSDGDFSFRYNELTQGGWTYVPGP